MSSAARRVVLRTLIVLSVVTSACGSGVGSGMFRTEYEYEEEIYLALDGSATVNVNASVSALDALRGATFDVNPRTRLDRGDVRAFFSGPGARVTRVSLSRRHGRRFVHVGVDVDDIRRLSQLAPFAWSRYHLDRDSELVAFRQIVGSPAPNTVPDFAWTGNEIVAFRIHIPSRIPRTASHNSPTGVQRGNILEWEQPLRDRLGGVPLDLQVQMEPQSILYSTLLLFAGTVVAAAATFGVVIWWVARRGRAHGAEMAGSRP
jgi:hypothetical protein